jgi:epoxide hydrolase 4
MGRLEDRGVDTFQFCLTAPPAASRRFCAQAVLRPRRCYIAEMNFESYFVERRCAVAGDIRLHVIACGPVDAPALLFVHGFPEFWWAWREQLAYFSKRFRCYALDMRGFNLSSQPTEVAAYKSKLLIEDLLAVIKFASGEVTDSRGRVHAVVAHDWGGAIAWSLAAQHPECMTRFVVLNSPHSIPFADALAHDPEQIAASQYMNWLRATGAEAVLAENDFERLVKMAALSTEEEHLRYRECWSRGLTGGCNYYRASPLHPDTEEAPGKAAALAAALSPEHFRVELPTQIIWGTGDFALRPVLLNGIENHVPNLRVDRVDGASHWLARENATTVNALIEEFISERLAK